MRQIAAEVGLSRSQTHRILQSSPLSTVVGGAEDDGEDDDGEDPWTLGENGTQPGLYDTAEDRWPAEPLTYCGTERVWLRGVKGDEGRWADSERWLDADGRSLNVLDLYRYRMHVAHELDDHERASALAADWHASGSSTRRGLGSGPSSRQPTERSDPAGHP